jgi:hypothetical protein
VQEKEEKMLNQSKGIPREVVKRFRQIERDPKGGALQSFPVELGKAFDIIQVCGE